MTDRSEALQTAYEARLALEDEYSNRYVEIESVEHHYDYADDAAEVDVKIDCVGGGATPGGYLYGDTSTYAIHDFIEDEDLPLRVRNEHINLTEESCELRITFRVET